MGQQLLESWNSEQGKTYWLDFTTFVITEIFRPRSIGMSQSLLLAILQLVLYQPQVVNSSFVKKLHKYLYSVYISCINEAFLFTKKKPNITSQCIFCSYIYLKITLIPCSPFQMSVCDQRRPSHISPEGQMDERPNSELQVNINNA